MVRFGEEKGEYLHAMYLDNLPALAAGREVSAYPKKLGAPQAVSSTPTRWSARSTTAAARGDGDDGLQARAAGPRGGQGRDLRADLHAEDPLELRQAGEPRICELVRTQIADITVKGAWTGPARLQLFAHALAPLADFPVREIVVGQPHPDRPDARAAKRVPRLPRRRASLSREATGRRPAMPSKQRPRGRPWPLSQRLRHRRRRDRRLVDGAVPGARPERRRQRSAPDIETTCRAMLAEERADACARSACRAKTLEQTAALRARSRTRGRRRRPDAGKRPRAARIQAAAVGAHRARGAAHALLLSSSSARPATEQARE